MGRPRSVITPALSAPWRAAFGLRSVRLSQVWAVTAILIPVVVIAASGIPAIDLTYHLRAGDVMLDTHSILRTDVFSAAAWSISSWTTQSLVEATAAHRAPSLAAPWNT